MDKIKSHHSTSFFVDQLLNMSIPKLAFDERPNKPADLSAHSPINHQSSSLTHSLSLIGNCVPYDRQTLNQLNGKDFHSGKFSQIVRLVFRNFERISNEFQSDSRSTNGRWPTMYSFWQEVLAICWPLSLRTSKRVKRLRLSTVSHLLIIQ